MPALWMTASMPPMALTWSATPRVSSALARSPMTTPAARGVRSSTLPARAEFRACSTTSWPWSSRCSAAARPSPVVEPVINTRAIGRYLRLDGLAAVDDECVADGKGGLVGAQQQHGGGDLLGRAHAADRLLRDGGLPSYVGAAGEAVHHLRVDHPGADGVDADARSDVVERGALGEGDDPELG